MGVSVDRALPKRLEPMLAVSARDPFDAPDKLFELKWDGIRVIAAIERSGVRLLSRSQRDVTAVYPEIVEGLRSAVARDGVVLDGELIALDQEGRPNFPLVMQRLHRQGVRSVAEPMAISFETFDILYEDFESVMRAPLTERKERLAAAVGSNDTIHLSHFELANGLAFFAGVQRMGLEGMVAKDVDSLYQPGRRSKQWVKVKTSRSANFVVGGYTFGGGRRKDFFGSLLLGAYDVERRLQYVGAVGGGFDGATLEAMKGLLTDLQTAAGPFAEAPVVDRLMFWCDPRLVIQVKYGELTDAGQLRFPIFVTVRPEIDPRDCTLEAVEEASTGPTT